MVFRSSLLSEALQPTHGQEFFTSCFSPHTWCCCFSSLSFHINYFLFLKQSSLLVSLFHYVLANYAARILPLTFMKYIKISFSRKLFISQEKFSQKMSKLLSFISQNKDLFLGHLFCSFSFSSSSLLLLLFGWLVFEIGSRSVDQAGMQWCKHSSLQP